MRSIHNKVASSEAGHQPGAVVWLTILALLFVQGASAQESGSIQGKVTDSSGAPIYGAVVTAEGDVGSSTTVTDMEGAFRISVLPPGNFKVRISASGMSDWTAESVASSAADTKPLLAVMQVAPAAASVTVGLSPEELAAEQFKRETQQRVAGIIPNYFVAYDNQATPLSTQQKFTLSFKTLIDPASFAAVGITAGIQQIRNSYHQFGQGSEAYGERFGAAYGTAATNLMLTSVLGASVLHQDPRYFYSGVGTRKQRAWYAVKSAFRARGDDGKWQPPYASVMGTVAAAELSDLYYPGSRTQYTLLGRGLMFHFGGLIALDLGQEFFLKRLTSHAPEGSAATVPTLREGTPVKLIAVDGFGPQGVVGGQTVTFVLAEELEQRGRDLARTGDVASGVVTEVTAGNSPDAAGSVALREMTLRAGGNINVPLRSNRARGAATPVQYHELPGSGKVEITLFVAQDVAFPQTQQSREAE